MKRLLHILSFLYLFVYTYISTRTVSTDIQTEIDMEFVRLLLTGVLIFIGARIVLTDENSENNSDLSVKDRLPNYIKPVYYDIELMMKENINSSFIIFGKCNINISIDLPTHNIRLHAQKQHILISKIDLYRVLFDQVRLYSMVRINNFTYTNENHILVLRFTSEIPRGSYFLTIRYDTFGDSSSKGFFKTSYVNEKGNRGWLAVTNFYPIGARQVFPCWDEPAMRAIFDISIKHHRNYLLLSNMPKQIIFKLKDDMVLTRFRTTPVISTYQIAIAVFDSEIRNGNIWCRRSTLSTNFTNFIFNAVTMNLGLEWGLYNFTDVEQIAIPGFQYDGIGHWRFISYRETAIIYDNKIDSVGHKINVACLVAREAARQSFSNLVSPSWWSHSWLNEGIAMVLGLDAISEILPNYGMLSIVQNKQESLRLDTQSIMKPLISEINSPSEINSFLSFSYYIKAPAILRMLQQMITNEIFLKGLHNYLKRHMYGSATVDDFWTAMQDALDKPQKFNFDLKKIFSLWTYHAHYPVLKVIEEEYARETMIHMWPKNVNITDLIEWRLPVTYATQKYPDFNKTLLRFTIPSITLSSMNEIVFIGSTAKDDWIIANLQQVGYYRVNYNTKNWLNIARVLNSENYTNIHVLNRAQIIDDAYHLFVRNKLSVHTFVELAHYLKQERNYIAWYPMIKALEDMSCFFPFQESAYIKKNMVAILETLRYKIQYEENSNIDDISNGLKQETAKWACILGSNRCKADADLILRSHLSHNKQILLPYWKHWMYCNGKLHYADRIEMSRKSREEHDNTIEKFMACSDATTIYNYLTSENYNKIKDIDRINIFHSVIARNAKNNFVLDYILSNFEQIIPKEVSTTALLINIINHVYSEEQLDKITAFVENYFNETEIIISVCKKLFDYNIINLLHAQADDHIKNIHKVFKNVISLTKHKIKTRLSEIKSLVDRYYKLVKIK